MPVILFVILLAVYFLWARNAEGLNAKVWRWTGRPLLFGCLPAAAILEGVGDAPLFKALALTYAAGMVCILVAEYFGFGSSSGSDSHRRGAKLLSADKLASCTAREKSRFRLGQVAIPERVEPFHFLIAGGTGAGKSQAFHQILTAAREQGQTAVVPDVGYEFTSKYFDPVLGDIILNPADYRAADWSPLAEMRSEFDADTLAKSLCPDKQGPDGEWQLYGQTLISAVLHRLYEAGTGTNAELVRLLTIAPADELAKVVEGLPAQAYFDAGASRMLSGIRAIVSSYIKPLAMLNPETGEHGFSIRRNIENHAGGWIFLPAQNDQLQTLKPLVAAQVDIAINALLSLSPSSTRRVWFAIDEFASWGRIQSIEPLLTKARKNGGCGALGIQSISQVRETYGRDNAQTLLSCLGTWLTLRAGDPETAEFVSKYIGDEEIRRVTEGGNKDGKSWNEQIAKQRAVMPAEMQNLPDRVGVLNIVGPIPAGWVTVPICERPEQADRFLPKERIRNVKPLTAARLAPPKEPQPAPSEIDVESLLDEPAESR